MKNIYFESTVFSKAHIKYQNYYVKFIVFYSDSFFFSENC